MNNIVLTCHIELPDNFRREDILDFHQRDELRVAERVDRETLQKGLAWAGNPACLTVRFQTRQATVELAVDGATVSPDLNTLKSMVRRMLGLTQSIEAFEDHYRNHPQLGALIATNPGLRVPLAATPFEALTWAIMGQQISVSAALSVRRKLIQMADMRHSCGLWCYPDAHRLVSMTKEDFRQAGFSQNKALTLITLIQLIEQDLLPLDQWTDEPPVEAIRTRLLQVRGIGHWTINYTLLRGFGYLDGSLHGDAAVRRKMQQLLGPDREITEHFAQCWLAEFTPWRALAAAHLWAMPS